MFKVPDISVLEYLQLSELDSLRYDIYINTIKPRQTFLDKSLDVSRLTYEEVELMKMTFRNPTMGDIADLFVMLWKLRGDMSQSALVQFYNASVFDLFRAKNYIQEFLTKVIEKEKRMLAARPDEKADMINAGERLAPIGYVLTKNKLAERFGVLPSVIAKMKYSEVFLILLADHMYSEVSYEYNQIK